MRNFVSTAQLRPFKVLLLILLAAFCCFLLSSYMDEHFRWIKVTRDAINQNQIVQKAITAVGRFRGEDDIAKNVTYETSSSSAFISEFSQKDDTDVISWDQKQTGISDVYTNNSLEQKCTEQTFFVYLCYKNKCEGWGDRMKAVVAVYVMATIMGRNFQIVHEKPPLCPLTDFYDYNEYNWYECIQYFDKSQRSTGPKLINFKQKFMNSIPTLNMSSLTTGRVSYIRTNRFWLRQLMKREDVRKAFPDFSTQEDGRVLLYSHILKRLFKPKEGLERDLSSFLLRNRNGTQLVCAHIRQLRANATRSLEFLKKYSDNKKYTIFIATDLEKNRILAKEILGNDTVVLDQAITHVDHRVKPSEGVVYPRDPQRQCEGLYTAIFEQNILSRCDILHLTASGFGLAGAALRQEIDRDLYCYNDNKEGDAFIPCTLLYAFDNFIGVQ